MTSSVPADLRDISRLRPVNTRGIVWRRVDALSARAAVPPIPAIAQHESFADTRLEDELFREVHDQCSAMRSSRNGQLQSVGLEIVRQRPSDTASYVEELLRKPRLTLHNPNGVVTNFEALCSRPKFHRSVEATLSRTRKRDSVSVLPQMTPRSNPPPNPLRQWQLLLGEITPMDCSPKYNVTPM